MKLKKLLSEVAGTPLMKVISNPYAKAFAQVNEEEQETYTATNKETGNVSVFKSKASRDAAVKSGSHEMRKSDKEGPVSDPTKKDTPNMFSKDTGYDAGGEEPKSDTPKTLPFTDDAYDEIEQIGSFDELQDYAQSKEGLSDEQRKQLQDLADEWEDAEGEMMATGDDDGYEEATSSITSRAMEVVFGPEDSWEEPKSDEPNQDNPFGVDRLVYNKRTKTVGIVRMADERGETKTDADGNVNTSELEPYNPFKYPHQKDAKVAPSTEKEISSRGLFQPFAQDGPIIREPKSEPKQDGPVKDSSGGRAGNPQVNKATKKKAEELGITPSELGREEYEKTMIQAAVAALTDSNYHSEARQLIAMIEDKPEWKEDPRKSAPSFDSPEYDEWQKSSVYSSEYYDADSATEELGQTASQEAGWNGVDALDGIAFELKTRGFVELAKKIQSVIKENKSTRLKDLI